ncbi:MBL fold metallo-hydrolase [uncultured Pseudosulfitobacter sp.]|uniref:MBL fold metallo-hydrolase n=1 Tax=uncultured Pseudosulfitobacter sp. TaxID=2854214 RepID=UPI0030DDCAC5
MTQSFVDTIPMLPFGMLNAFLVVQDGRAMLVDTGLPNAAPKVAQALRARGLGWSDLALTVLTHAHIDHAGSAVAVRELSQAPVLAHADEVALCQGQPPVLKPSGPFGRLFQKTGAIQQRFDYFSPDRTLQGQMLDLNDYGFAARLVHTPGHTAGSVSVLLDDGRVIAGDLAASGILLGGLALRGRPKSPPFEEDIAGVIASLEHLLAQGCTQFYLGHGGPLPAQAIARHVGNLRKLL